MGGEADGGVTLLILNGSELVGSSHGDVARWCRGALMSCAVYFSSMAAFAGYAMSPLTLAVSTWCLIGGLARACPWARALRGYEILGGGWRRSGISYFSSYGTLRTFL